MLGLEEDSDHCNFQVFQHKMSPSSPNDSCSWRNLSHLGMKEGVVGDRIANAAPALMTPPIRKVGVGGSRFKKEINSDMMQSEMVKQAAKPAPIKFHTAGGRSLSVSSGALKYARSLLGDPELGTLFSEGDADDSDLSYFKEGRSGDSLSKKENGVFALPNKRTTKSTTALKNFIPPLRSSSNQVILRVNTGNIAMADNLIKKFDAVDNDGLNELDNKSPSSQNPSNNVSSAPFTTVQDNSLDDCNCLRVDSLGKPSGRPLADISNRTGAAYANIKLSTCEKRKLWRNSVSPFKRPRTKFSTPLKRNVPFDDGNSQMLLE